jgi:hypothetical protein
MQLLTDWCIAGGSNKTAENSAIDTGVYNWKDFIAEFPGSDATYPEWFAMQLVRARVVGFVTPDTADLLGGIDAEATVELKLHHQKVRRDLRIEKPSFQTRKDWRMSASPWLRNVKRYPRVDEEREGAAAYQQELASVCLNTLTFSIYVYM